MTEQSTNMGQVLSFHNEIAEMKKTFVISVIMLMITGQWDTRPKQLTSSVDTNNRTHLIDRSRRDVSHLFYELGDNNARRSYRMTPSVFKKLSKILQPHLEIEYDNALLCHRIPNGPISHSIRLSITLRYLAGGQPMDIALVHGVSHSEVFDSIWKVIDAINVEPNLAIHFPEDHEEQLQLADDFKKKSQAGFSNCMGAIDGILIWIHKPTKADVKLTNCGAAKFFCGRKKKFGLNMQAVCDSKRRFLDVYIGHPGSTSDFLSFQTSPLRHRLDEPNFLHPDVCLYGDNAYVNTQYMVTPFKAVSEGPEDAYSYYQSQLRICIECAFGMLCHRFGILRKAIPQKITLKKTTALVMACCKLHNYCINNGDAAVPTPRDDDNMNVALEGGIPLDATTDYRPFQLLDSGNHSTDFNRYTHRRRDELHRQERDGEFLPRDQLLQQIKDKDLRRPTPADWR
jgi:DDE superfamily endonuclease